jgi:transcriptional regulator with XRE-family HTH domain
MSGSKIKQWREARDLSQEELAKLLGVDVMTVSRWERGTRTAPGFLALALETLGRTSKPTRRRK